MSVDRANENIAPIQASGSANVPLSESTAGIRPQPQITIPNTFLAADSYVYTQSSGIYVGIINNTSPQQTFVHADAGVVMNDVINYLTSGSVIGGTSLAPGRNLYSGGRYGTIYVGPGIYNVYSSIVLKSNIVIQGAGFYATKFQLASGAADSANATIFKSSLWDTQSTAGSGSTNLQVGDPGIILRDFEVYGNFSGSPAVVTTNPCNVSGGALAPSWGHGIALYTAAAVLENLSIHHCAGAGLIVQSPATNYGLGALISGDQGAAAIPNVYVRNCAINGNKQQGYLCRAQSDVDRLWTYYNGEGGVDVQTCGFYKGDASRFFNGWHFLDGQNHTSYDISGYEFMCGGPNYVYNTWVEGSNAGDSMVLGIAGASGGSIDYTVSSPAGGSDIGNLMGDFPKGSAVMINSTFNRIQGRINGPSSTTAINGISVGNCVGVTVLANNNVLDLDLRNFTGSGTTGILIGQSGTVAGSNKISLKGHNNYLNISWGNAGNIHNSIFGQFFSFSGQTLVGGSGAVTIAQNQVIIQSLPNANAGDPPIRAYNKGLSATQSGDGATTVFNISHGLYTSPGFASVNPATTAAIGSGGFKTTTANSGFITLTYVNPPPAGNGNLQWYFVADVFG